MKILLISNSSRDLYLFKKELIIELSNPNSYIDNNPLRSNDIYICVPSNDNNNKFEELGCQVINIDVDRRGTSIFKDAKLLINYLEAIKNIEPDVTMTFTIKPNVYGGLACRITNTKYITGVMGLGSSIRSNNYLSKFIGFLYKTGSKASSYINFENKADLDYFNKNIYDNNKSYLLPGSGVNLDKFKYKEYPRDDGTVRFLTIGRVMRDKGSYELLEAAKIIKDRYNNVEFNFVGLFEEDRLKSEFLKADQLGIINYLGYRKDVPEVIEKCHCIIHPSYHEGLSNALLEAAASGRPVIASDVPGCRETYLNNVTGLSINPKNIESIVKAIEDFIEKDYESKKLMGIKARKYIEDRFDRKDVVAKHIEQINNITFND